MPVIVQSGGGGALSNGLIVRVTQPALSPTWDAGQRFATQGPTVTELWSPAYLSSVRGWWKANEIGQADGTSVVSLPDASGTGNAATSVGNDPVQAAANLNSLNTLRFVGASPDYLLLPSGAVSAFTQGAVFYVAIAGSSSTMSLPPVRFGTAAGGLERYNSDGAGAVASGFLSTAIKTITAPGGTTSWHIAGFRSQASDWRMRWNGTEIFTTATNTVGAAAGQPYFGFNANGDSFDGNLAEVVLTNSFLTTAEAELIEGYLAWKWGLQATLAGGHTYASAAPTIIPVALTGQSVSAAQGSLGVSSSPALTGQSVTVAQGSIAASSSLALSGQAIVAARGSVLAAPSIALSGQSVIAARGTLTPASSFVLSGQSATIAQGSLTAAPSFALSGQALTVAKGSVVAAPSIALSGQGISVARGSITPTAAIALTGQSIVAAQGSIVASPSLALSGQAVTVSRGSVLGTTSVALTGNGIAAAQGSLTPTFNAALVGRSLIAGQGTVTPGAALPLVGASVVASRAALSAGSGIELTGFGTIIAQGSITAETLNTYLFWQPGPLIGRRRSVSRSR